MSFLDLLFPKKCVVCSAMGEYLCPACFSQLSFDSAPKCLVCGRPSWNGLTHPKCIGRYTIDGYFTAVTYKRIAKKLLYQFKYRPYLSDLQTVMTDLLYENLVQNEIFVHALQESPVLIPIPLSKKKLRTRGYNQSEILAKSLGKRFHLCVAKGLVRIKETRPQYGLKREERVENIQGAFAFQNTQIQSQKPENQNVRNAAIIVDDILTTGSTMLEAAKVLKRNGYKKVWGVAFAQD